MAEGTVYYGPARKKGLLGTEGFKTGEAAYRAYENARLRDVEDPALAPKDKFMQIWGWTLPPTRTSGVARRLARPA